MFWPLLSNGIDTDDRIVLLRPGNDSSEQANDAIHDIEQTVREIGPNATVVVEDIAYETFAMAVMNCVDVLEAAEGTVIVVFDGGLREVFLPFTIAAVSRPALIDTIRWAESFAFNRVGRNRTVRPSRDRWVVFCSLAFVVHRCTPIPRP